jgi:signal transduction histidine kinase
LSMVKKIVNIYKGEIWLESKIEKGTTFYFTIKK